MSLPEASWGSSGGVADRTVRAQLTHVRGNNSVEEDPQLAANRHSLVEKIGELAASAHALGEGHFPFPSSLSESAAAAQRMPQAQAPSGREDVDMLVRIRRGVRLRKTVTDDRSAPRLLW